MDVWGVCAIFCVCVVLYLGRGLATSWSPVQGVLPSVNDQETEKSALCSKSGSKEEKEMRWKCIAYFFLWWAVLGNTLHLSLQFAITAIRWLIKRHVMNTYCGTEGFLHAFWRSVLHGGQWSASYPDCLPRGRKPWYPLPQRLGGPQNLLGRRSEKKNLYFYQESPQILRITQLLDFVHRLTF
jgi:hypothetical protein